jgi:uncharacterized membrane protein
MTASGPRANEIRRNAALGVLVAWALVALLALILGADLWVAVLVGFGVGLFVGGGLGLLLAARSASSD